MSIDSRAVQSLTINPIGIIRTRMKTKFDAPHQPKDGKDESNIIELFPNLNFERALQDLQGFSRIWLIWWSHRNATWRPRVMPPRGNGKRRGVFATRSPHRPNPICMTAVPLLSVEGRMLTVGNADLIDGTPILDIKPYIPAIDSFPDASRGWLEEVEAFFAMPPSFEVALSEQAAEQIKWLRETWSVDFFRRAKELLERDPSPHRTRRITAMKEGNFRMGCGGWRIFFAVSGNSILIERVDRGFPEDLLQKDDYTGIPDKDAQIAFGKKWPQSQTAQSPAL